MSPVVATLALTLTLAAQPAGAPQAAYLDELARRAFARGRYAEALALFSEVQTVAPSGRNTYNMAAAADLAAKPALAHALWTRYLAAAPDDAEARRAHARGRLEDLERRVARLEVRTEPPGAAVFVDRRDLGRHGHAPLSIALPPGRHDVWAELPGYHPARAVADVPPRGVTQVDLHLARRTGHLRVEVRPATEATLLGLEDGDAGWRPMRAGHTATVAAGRWRIRAEAPGHAPAELEVRVPAGGLEARTVVLPPRPPPSGWLLISAGALEAELRVDGEPYGRVPARLQLAAGAHAVRVERAGAVLWSGAIRIEADRAEVVWVPPE